MWKRIGIFVLLIAIAGGSFYGGFKLRRYIYTETRDIRFVRNVENAWLWGRNARAEGIFSIYQKVYDGQRYRSNFELDYPPLRLLTASFWQGWTDRHFNNPRQWDTPYEFTAPMLWTNTMAAALASVLVFLLIQQWTRTRGNSLTFRGVVAGLIGAAIMWLNPAMIWDGYVWVQWDIWPIPFFLAAVYLACLNRWFAAGMCLAIGASFKGQMLIAAPVMIAWPIFQWRIGAVCRLLAGAALMFMAIVFPWMKPSIGAGIWGALMLLALAAMIPFTLRTKVKPPWLAACGIFALLLAACALAGPLLPWPWMTKASVPIRLLPAALIGFVAMARFFPVRAVPHIYAFSVALILLLMIPLHDASTAWFTRGFEFGAERNRQMYGQATYNVLALIQPIMGWPKSSLYEFTGIPMIGSITTRTLMGCIHLVLLLACGFAAARHHRNGDPRFLLAITLPWLLFYMLLTQMFSRYLAYFAALSALLPALGAGPLLGLVINVIALLGIMENHYQIANVNPWNYSWLPYPQTLAAMDPGIGWMLVLATLILLLFGAAHAGVVGGALGPRPRRPGRV